MEMCAYEGLRRSVRTEEWYQTKIKYHDIAGNKEAEVVVSGVDDLVYIYTHCNGKSYDKLIVVKQKKTKTPLHNLDAAVNEVVDHLEDWLSRKGYKCYGTDFYNHDIKTKERYINGYTIGGYFERVLENC